MKQLELNLYTLGLVVQDVNRMKARKISSMGQMFLERYLNGELGRQELKLVGRGEA